MNIFLRYEVTARELDAHILTGLIAASRGHVAIVCDWPMMMRGILLRRRQPGFVHMNSLTPGKSTFIFHRIFKFFGYRISSLDQEAGIQNETYEAFAKVRYSEETVSSADLVFCWGRDDYECLSQLFHKHSEKIVMTGSPRVDLWRPKFSSVYAKPKPVVTPFALILSSLGGPLTSLRLHEGLISLRENGYFDLDPETRSKAIQQYKEGTDLVLAYLDLFRFLSLNYQDLAVIVKPHPGEDAEIWREILGETTQVHVDDESTTSQLIRESVVAITSGSTTAFEAQLSETPLISFQPVETPHRNFGFANNLGIQAKTVEDVHAALCRILNPEFDEGFKSVLKVSNVDLSQKVYFDDEQLAAERMVDSWEMTLNGGPKHSSGGSIFSMPKKELKYFVASAFPSLMSLFIRKRPLRLFGRSRKRPPQDRELVRVRVEEMRSILGLQHSVSFRFRGRGGLLIEPSIGATRRRLSNQFGLTARLDKK